LRRPDYALSDRIGAKKSQFDRWFFNWFINLAGKLLMTMSTSLAPPSPGGGGAFTLAAWNIRCGRNAGLTSVAKTLAQMGVGIAVVTETKITDARYTRLSSGYKILASKVARHNQGGIALLWKENHQGFEVESAKILTPNFLTFQLVTGDERFIAWEFISPPQTRWGWKTFGLPGKPVRTAACPSS
jgi:hypothetical protein